MGYNNVLFNGRSLRNAIITKLSEDKHLTSALFANSNITILIDIISYMYQSMMANLRQAASESMFSDTVFFENATRLAKLIGYYAKGQSPYTMIARRTNNEILPEFGVVRLGYGPYNYRFSVVEHNINNDQKLIKLALGEWNVRSDFVSDGSKFQEFIIENEIDDPSKTTYISQRFARVITVSPDGTPETRWEYSQTPLFLRQNRGYRDLDADSPEASRTEQVIEGNVFLFNFYIDENANYVLKFGDGLSTAIPPEGSQIYVFYITSSETDKTITADVKTAIANSDEGVIESMFGDELLDKLGLNQTLNADDQPRCIPTTQLIGYRDKDSVENIRQFSRESFSRQNRLVTKQDYHDYLLEVNPEWKDVCVENNWEYISTFYGWLYAIDDKSININNLQQFNSQDPADANNIYIWFLSEDMIDYTSESTISDVGIDRSMETGEDIGKTIGSIKDITEHPVFLYALCKRWVPCAFDLTNSEYLTLVQYEHPDPFKYDQCVSYFRIHIDTNHSNKLNYIKSETYKIVKKYLFEDIKLGKTPNVPSLIKDLMAIDGVVNVTTVFNMRNGENGECKPNTEIEVNGMKFLTWTDTGNQLFSTESDRAVSYNLPNIPEFQFFKSAQSYSDFIKYSLDFKVDYTL